MWFFTVLLSLAPISGVFALWPLPTTIQNGSTVVKLSSNFMIDYSSIPNVAALDFSLAATRTNHSLWNDKLGPLAVGRGSSDADALKNATTPQLSFLTVSLTPGVAVRNISEELKQPIKSRTKLEAYNLTIPASGNATLTADSTLGLLRGLQTFEQLWYSYQTCVYTNMAPLNISDVPAFPYRGLLLDTARNFMPHSDIMRTLDAMSMVKMNQLHWHVTDAESFPLVIPDFQDLADHGAYGPEMTYTAQNVNDIVQYAGQRGIDVLVEIDIPSHSWAMSQAHPEYMACADPNKPWSDLTTEPPAGQINITYQNAIDYTGKMLSAVASMFPSNMMSTGGDNIIPKCYNYNDTNSTDLTTALGKFMHTAQSAIQNASKTPVIYDQFLKNYPGVPLSTNTTVMFWESANLKSITDQNYNFIHMARDYFWLSDGVGSYNPNSNGSGTFVSWQKAYFFDYTADFDWQGKRLNLLGGQSVLWSEQTGPESLDSILWPRGTVTAEKFWTGKNDTLTPADVIPRLNDITFRLRQRGVKATQLQPYWCALRPASMCST